MYADTQTHGLAIARHPRIVWVSPVYMNTETQGLAIARHPGIYGLGISGVRGYSDTGLAIARHPEIVRDSLGISGVHGYSDTGVGHSQTS